MPAYDTIVVGAGANGLVAAMTSARTGHTTLVVEGEAPTLTGPHCASVHGFSLHANTQVPAHRRNQSERLLRYTARGAVSLERLAQDTNGHLYTHTPPPLALKGNFCTTHCRLCYGRPWA